MEQAITVPRNQAKKATRPASDANPKAFDINGCELPSLEDAIPNSWGEDNWLLRNPEALAALDRGLAQSAAGLGVKRSFLEFADLETEE